MPQRKLKAWNSLDNADAISPRHHVALLATCYVILSQCIPRPQFSLRLLAENIRRSIERPISPDVSGLSTSNSYGGRPRVGWPSFYRGAWFAVERYRSSPPASLINTRISGRALITETNAMRRRSASRLSSQTTRHSRRHPAAGYPRPRGGSHKSSCASNLRQMGIPVHTYHDARKSLRPSYVAGVSPPRRSNATWVAMLLRDLDKATPSMHENDQVMWRRRDVPHAIDRVDM